MRSLISLAVMCLLVTSVNAAPDLEDSVAALGVSVDARLTEIGDPPAKETKKEASRLRKVISTLAKFEEADKRGLKAVAKAAKFILKSGTEDSGIASALSTLLDALEALALLGEDDAEAARDDLDLDKHVAKVAKRIDKHRGQCEAAASNPSVSAAAKILGKAILGFRKTVAKASKLRDKELAKIAAGGLVLGPDGTITYAGSGSVTIKDMIWDLSFTFSPGETHSFVGRASDLPDWEPIVLEGTDNFFDGLADLVLPGTLALNGWVTYVTSEGNFTIRIK